MKNYFKKFSIMFVMLLAIAGVGLIQNGVTANAADTGWQRYDDTNNNDKFKYTGKGWNTLTDSNWNNNSIQQTNTSGGEVFFKFYGSRLRIIQTLNTDININANIIIDDKTVGSYTNKSTSLEIKKGVFEKTDLFLGIHTVLVKSTSNALIWDAIDIDSNGVLIPYDESISLNKSSTTLTVGDSEQLTATTTPASVGVTWKSSDEKIAKYDSTTGKVIAVGEGTCTITATTADGLTATCIVTVTPKGTDPKPPVDPTTGDANLFIELVDGNIKSYNVSSTEISNFKQWYLDRDNTKSNNPYYQFTKGTYKDYVIHDKIDWFEVK